MVYPTARGIPRRRIVSADNERVALLFSLEWGHFPVVAVIYLRAEVSTGWTLPHVDWNLSTKKPLTWKNFHRERLRCAERQSAMSRADDAL